MSRLISLLRVVQVAEVYRLGGADNHAGGAGIPVDAGLQTLRKTGIDSFLAEDALLDHACLMRIQDLADFLMLGQALAGEVLVLPCSS